jgi:ribonuclease-3
MNRPPARNTPAANDGAKPSPRPGPGARAGQELVAPMTDNRRRQQQQHEESLAAVETLLGHAFNDRRLLLAALTHPSYRHEHPETGDDFQRLEFLGDAVLNLLTAEHVYRRDAASDEGLLTVLRSQCASGRALARLARELNLGACLRLGRSAASSAREKTSGRILAGALEALFGALWLDGGAAAAAKAFARLFGARLQELTPDPWAGNPKGELQDIAQRRFQTLPGYSVEESCGPAHKRRYRVAVTLGGLRAEGEGDSRRAAERQAAHALLATLKPTAPADRQPPDP